jgi:glucosamine--fructose-6-phosphate aminotransferase (isomerizing)
MLGEWMEREIREQPDVLAGGAARYGDELAGFLDGRKFDLVLLAARGSSDNAALYGRYLIEVFLGIPVSLAAPSVLTRFHSHVRYSNCLAIGISQSGAAPDVSEVLGALRAGGHATLAITNTPGSLLTREAEHSLHLDVGKEQSVAATKTYIASLLALYELVRALGGVLPCPLSLLPGKEWLGQAENSVCESAGTVVRSSPVFALGRGFDFSTAQESALKLMECALIPAKAFSSADFEHGPKALAGHGSAAIDYDGDSPELSAQGCEIIVPPSPPARIPAALKPIWNVIFGQWLALHSARARGLNPDVPRHIQKVTETL